MHVLGSFCCLLGAQVQRRLCKPLEMQDRDLSTLRSIQYNSSALHSGVLGALCFNLIFFFFLTKAITEKCKFNVWHLTFCRGRQPPLKWGLSAEQQEPKGLVSWSNVRQSVLQTHNESGRIYVINWPVLTCYRDVRNLELINLGSDRFHIRAGKYGLSLLFL